MKIRAHLSKREPGRSRRNGVLTGEVVRSLRTAIFQGEFRPGDPLPEMHLAKRFGVSQAVIREALSTLSHTGLVKRFPNKGTFVTNLTPAEIAEHVRLRLLLETTLWLDAAHRATSAALNKLGEKLEVMKIAVASEDYHEIAQADLEFHREIWRISGDSTMAKILDQITTALFAFVSVRRSQKRDSFSHMIAQHEAIIEVLRRGDPQEIIATTHTATERSYAGFLQPSLDPAVWTLGRTSQGFSD